MSKELPKFSSQVPYAPTNWSDRDALVGRLMEVVEAAMPEGTQQTAVKNLIKKLCSEHFENLFNVQFDSLKYPEAWSDGSIRDYSQAIWDKALELKQVK